MRFARAAVGPVAVAGLVVHRPKPVSLVPVLAAAGFAVELATLAAAGFAAAVGLVAEFARFVEADPNRR